MDAYSSGEELIIKTRKPYTITKQRERWTDEEHNRFLEALKLYGRAWQRIEEHIGTKTAVQIRSHAQKFFSKLEKEALIKGVPLGHAFDIDIPPPRPKRKPSNPYPRKTNTGAPSSNLVGAKDRKKLASASSLHASEQLVDLENDPPHEKPSGTEKSARTNGTLDDDNCSEVLTLFHQEVPCASISSVNKSSIPAPLGLKNPCTFREFVPSKKEVSDHATIDESNLNVKPKENQKLERTDVNYIDLDNGVTKAPNLETSCLSSHEKPVQGERTNEPKKHEKLGLLSANEMQTNQKYPRHVPVQFVNGISGTCLQTPSPNVTYPSSIIHQMGGAHGNSNLFANEHNMSRSSIHQSLPTFSPSFTPLCNNQDNYRSFLNSTFSSLIVSTLLLNPAAHAAASLAASFWPCTNVETMVDSPSTTFGGFPFRSMSPSPSIAAIAAATVAAASAWWAAHGLVPVCPPLHSGFTCTPAPTTGVPSIGTDQAPVINKEIKDNPQDPPQQLDPDFSEPLKRHSASKSPPMPSSDSETGGARPICTEVENHVQQPVQVTSFQDPNNVKNKKQVDRSSCGSNTPSSSEVETDALEKHEKGEEESKELDLSPAAGETNNRRGRTTININESWKEVSEEGRLAFQALFNREVLPQSFSPPHDLRNKEHPRYSTEEGKKLLIEKDESGLQFDLSNKTWGTCPDSGMEQEESLRSSNNAEELVMTGLGHAKLKARRTGFKPYKRCSLEAKESRVANGSGQGEEKGPKRIRLGGEAST